MDFESQIWRKFHDVVIANTIVTKGKIKTTKWPSTLQSTYW